MSAGPYGTPARRAPIAQDSHAEAAPRIRTLIASAGVSGGRPAIAATSTVATTHASDGPLTVAETTPAPTVIARAKAPRTPSRHGRRVCTPHVCL